MIALKNPACQCTAANFRHKQDDRSVLSPLCSKEPFPIRQIQPHADQRGENRTGRRRPSHGIQTVRKQPGSQISTGNPHTDNGYRIVQKREARFPISAKKTAETKMHTGSCAIPDIRPQILSPHPQYFTVIGKQPYKRPGSKLTYDPQTYSEACGNGYTVAQCLFCPFMYPGSHILGSNGRNGGKHGEDKGT